MKKVLASIMLALMLVLSAGTANAAQGDPSNVWNSSSSVGSVAVYKGVGQAGIWLRPGTNTTMYTGWYRAATIFRIENGCRGASQYSPAGQYPYADGRTYWTNGVTLNFRVVCYA